MAMMMINAIAVTAASGKCPVSLEIGQRPWEVAMVTAALAAFLIKFELDFHYRIAWVASINRQKDKYTEEQYWW